MHFLRKSPNVCATWGQVLLPFVAHGSYSEGTKKDEKLLL